MLLLAGVVDQTGNPASEPGTGRIGLSPRLGPCEAIAASMTGMETALNAQRSALRCVRDRSCAVDASHRTAT